MTRTSTIERGVFVGMIVLGSIQGGACVVDDPDDGWLEDDVATAAYASSGTSGSGSTNTCVQPVSCTSRCGWSCAEIPVPGQGPYPARKTSGWAKTTYKYTLRATKYTVSGTWGLGTHTGVGFTEEQTRYWESFRCENNATVMSSGSSSVAPFWISNNYNHGRTVLAAAGWSAPNATVTFEVGGSQPAAYRDAMLQCISWAQRDGFCDQVCGNDAYTLPDAAKNDGDDPHPGDPMPFSNRRNYGVSTTPDPARWSHVWTHHLRVPRYGHNSNNDAEAQNAMLQRCNSFRGWLDSNFDALVSPSHSCGPNWPQITGQIRQHIIGVCNTHCGGVRFSNYANDTTGDVNKAKPNSSLNAVDGTNAGVNPGSVGCPPAGNFAQGLWGWNVCGM